MSINLCVPSDTPSLKNVLLFLMRLNWGGVALTSTVFRAQLDSVTPPRPDVVLADMRAALPQSDDFFSHETLSRLRVAGGLPVFSLLTRVTLRVVEAADLTALTKAAPRLAQLFDFFSVRPDNDEMLLKCCESAQCDIVSLDFSLRTNWSALTGKCLAKVITRGIFFEVDCGPAFRSRDSDRVSFFSNVRKLVAATRGKHLIFAHGSREWNDCRSPMDLVNLGILCGLSEQDAKSSVFENARHAREKAMLRGKTWRSAIANVSQKDAANFVKLENAFDVQENDGEEEEEEKKKKKKKKKKNKDKKKKKKKERRLNDSGAEVSHRSHKKQKKEPLIL